MEYKVIAVTTLFVLFFSIIVTSYGFTRFSLNYGGLNITDIVNTSLTNSTTQQVSAGFDLDPFPVCQLNGGLFDVLNIIGCGIKMAGWFFQFIGIKTNIIWLAPIFIAMGAVVLYVIARLFRGGG